MCTEKIVKYMPNAFEKFCRLYPSFKYTMPIAIKKLIGNNCLNLINSPNLYEHESCSPLPKSKLLKFHHTMYNAHLCVKHIVHSWQGKVRLPTLITTII